MKTKAIVLASLITPLTSMALASPSDNPSTGSLGNKPMSEALIAQAKATGKLILVGDAQFGDKHISAFLDKNFVIQQTQADGPATAYLLYDSDGALVHRVVADVKYPYELAVKIKRGLNQSTQYYSLIERFEAGDHSVELLEEAIIGAFDAQDDTNGKRLMRSYLDALHVPMSDEQQAFVARYSRHTDDPGFAYLMERMAHPDKLVEIIFVDEYLPKVSSKGIDASGFSKAMKAKYPAAALASHIDRATIEWLEMRGESDVLKAAVNTYIHQYRDELSPEQLAYYSALVR